jgi:threonyl-tRNA synthetase
MQEVRILQLHVDSISYQPIAKEIQEAEDSDTRRVSFENVVVAFTAFEQGDNVEAAMKAVDDLASSMKNLKAQKLLIYPYAHLSSSLAPPQEAKGLLSYMVKRAGEMGLEVEKAPFGWNKAFSLSVKGHPLAEQSRVYGVGPAPEKPPTQKRRGGPSVVKKSDWSGLPETDHRTIGERLDLYSFQEVSPSMVYWHPNGFTIFKKLVEFMRRKEAEYSYAEVSTPAVANTALFEVSGHKQHYKDNMFTFQSGFGELGLKPMNCPSTILIYKTRMWSYRDLPFRTATFDRLYRSELSGVVTGLFRVKELTQDDGHIFAREDQVPGELDLLLKMTREVYETFRMNFSPNLSTMPDEHAGDEETWRKATAHLKDALERNGLTYQVKEKEGSFYAPKIDFDVFDSRGRAWQCATIQLDYQMPRMFKLSYVGEDGKEHTPAMIHRALLGSLERFIGILVEHYQGRFPVWLAPVQVRVIPVSDRYINYARVLYDRLRSAGVRADFDFDSSTLNLKIRRAQLQKIPYMAVVGKREEESGTVSVRSRDGQLKDGETADDLVKKVLSSSESYE